MIIEIRGAGFRNKGAELMLLAIVNKLRAAYPTALLTIAPSPADGSVPYRKPLEHGLYPKASLSWCGWQVGGLASLAPRRLREMYGIVLDRQVDVVIDAAGFAYGDPWGARSTQALARATGRWRRQGTTVILMPQAFGPYGNTRIRKAMRRVITNVDLIMPREQISYQHLVAVAGERENIRLYPDCTHLLDGVVPESFAGNRCGVCLVPNYRMIDQVDAAGRAAYLPFMIRCARQLRQKGVSPFVLVHETTKDLLLAEQISQGAGGLPIVVEDDPIKIKGILGASLATIGCRFHGLVSALSQGVPSLATGWSHKYQALFRDYGFPEGLVSVQDTDHALAAKIDGLVDAQANRRRSESLNQYAARFRLRCEAMWSDVFATIERNRCTRDTAMGPAAETLSGAGRQPSPGQAKGG